MQRRNFLRLSALGAAACMMPEVAINAATAAPKKTSANGKVNLGFIGVGNQSKWLWSQFQQLDDVRIVAGCDVFEIKRERFKKRVTEYYQSKGEKNVKIDVYEDFEDLLAREDIDAVVIATPDHQHARIAITACKAGKDVYLEKPMTLTIYEGQQLVKAVRKYNRILQVGSQQRSSPEFIHAATLVREGLLGKVERIQSYVGRYKDNATAAPIPLNLPKDEIPAGLNWEKWLGPLPESVYYSKGLDEPIANVDGNETFWGEWRYYKPTGGGLMTDWGAHVFDVAQWALGKDGNGPVEVIPPSQSYYGCLTFKYDNGVVMTEKKYDKDGHLGVKIYGEEGWISVARGYFECSNPKFNQGAIEIKETNHYREFIDAVKTRIDPNVPVETGHSSCTVCNLANIAIALDRAVKWNPIVQKIMNDPEATALMHYQYRDGYTLE